MGVLSPALAVRNMKETVKFYKNSLGFKLEIASPDANNPQYAELSKDGIVLMFILAKSCNIGDEEKLGIGVTLYMQIDGDIDEYYLELKKRGVKITVGIADEPYGIRDFTVEDVNGYILTFNQLSSKVKTRTSVPVTRLEYLGEGTSAIYTTSTFQTPMAVSKATMKYSRAWSTLS